ncbi:hypothetical protein [Pseudomonas sp. PB101]|uniref:hypothetical protein n=1 Tax=Pseudomonas sp. PB101 TaxID=2495428 RepID=UPI0013659BBB|nr:hypothetical protein [Pseudomonas sp. PB101]
MIKTLFKKIVHNKNDIFRITPATGTFTVDLPPNRTPYEPFSELLTIQADFLQAHANSSKR